MRAKSTDLFMQHIFNGKSIVTKGLIKNEDYNIWSALLHIMKRWIVSWIFGLAKIHYEIQQVRQFMQIFHDSYENLWLNSKIGVGIKFKLMLLCQEIATELASKKVHLVCLRRQKSQSSSQSTVGTQKNQKPNAIFM